MSEKATKSPLANPGDKLASEFFFLVSGDNEYIPSVILSVELLMLKNNNPSQNILRLAYKSIELAGL